MATLKHFIFLPFIVIGLLGKVSVAQAGSRLCYPGDNITLIQTTDSKISKTIRKPTLDFWQHYWGHVRTPLSNLLFGRPKMPETNITQHCHPYTEELSNLLMKEYQFSWMKIISDVQIIDGHPWWCKDYGTLNHPQPFDENLGITHVCYLKDWTDGIGKFMCDLQHWDQIILRSENELIWRCIPFEFWCRDISSYNECLSIIVTLLFFGILLPVLSKVMNLIFNWFLPVIGPIFPKPAPAA